MDRLDDLFDENDEPYQKFMKPVCIFLSDYGEALEDPDIGITGIDMKSMFIELVLVIGKSLEMDEMELRRLKGLVHKDLTNYLMCVTAHSQGESPFYNLESIGDMAGINFSSKDQIRDIVDNHDLVNLLLSSPPTAVFLFGLYKSKIEDLISQYNSLGALDELQNRRVAHRMYTFLWHRIAEFYAMIGSSADSHIHIGPSIDSYICVEGNDFAQSYLVYLTEQLKRA